MRSHFEPCQLANDKYSNLPPPCQPVVESVMPKAKKNRKPDDMPRRPLSAYNIFFREQRSIILQEREELKEDDEKYEKARGLFASMGKKIAAKWKSASAEEKARLQALSNVERQRYHEEMEKYKRERKRKTKSSAQKSRSKKDGNDPQHEERRINEATNEKDTKPESVADFSPNARLSSNEVHFDRESESQDDHTPNIHAPDFLQMNSESLQQVLQREAVHGILNNHHSRINPSFTDISFNPLNNLADNNPTLFSNGLSIRDSLLHSALQQDSALVANRNNNLNQQIHPEHWRNNIPYVFGINQAPRLLDSVTTHPFAAANASQNLYDSVASISGLAGSAHSQQQQQQQQPSSEEFLAAALQRHAYNSQYLAWMRQQFESNQF
jgi:hypothetical protein